MTLGIVIQARMGSTRLPGKVMKTIAGRPLLDHVLGRLRELRHPATVVVATTTSPADDVIESFCLKRRIACFRGSETDVLDRYRACAEAFGFAHVVRLTADNPFPDIAELDRLVDLHLRDRNDYTHSFGSLPVGIGAEIFTAEALFRSAREGLAANHREHVNEFIQENPQAFRIGRLPIDPAKCDATLRLTVDTSEDYARACALAEQAAGPWLTTEEAIRLCSRSA